MSNFYLLYFIGLIFYLAIFILTANFAIRKLGKKFSNTMMDYVNTERESIKDVLDGQNTSIDGLNTRLRAVESIVSNDIIKGGRVWDSAMDESPYDAVQELDFLYNDEEDKE